MTEDYIKLSQLLEDIVSVSKQEDLPVTGLTLDSRQVTSGDLFLALRGANIDASQFIVAAQEAGAAAVIMEGESALGDAKIKIPVFASVNLRQQVGLIADRFYHWPARRIKLIGITGTNGKTSTSYFLAQTLQSLKKKCAVLGTTGYGLLGNLQTASHTTPDPLRLRQLLNEFVQQNIDYVSMEVSSHALQQERVTNLDFAVAVLTNLSRDHLDYHGNMENYAASKQKLFHWPNLTHVVLNMDDAFGRQLLSEKSGDGIIVYSLDRKVSDGRFAKFVFGEILQSNKQGYKLKLVTHQGSAECKLNLLGEFNISNVLAVTAVLLSLEFQIEQIAESLIHCQAVPGRMQSFGGSHGLPTVIVDYAHTPDALEKALQALMAHKTSAGKIWLVFGCGGDRDQGKRPLMGKVAEKFAHHVVLTNDNPRSETDSDIVHDIMAGITQSSQVIIMLDRQQAIRYSIMQAQEDDIVLVAGKGHENYQLIGEQRHHFSDIETVTQVLQESAA